MPDTGKRILDGAGRRILGTDGKRLLTGDGANDCCCGGDCFRPARACRTGQIAYWFTCANALLLPDVFYVTGGSAPHECYFISDEDEPTTALPDGESTTSPAGFTGTSDCFSEDCRGCPNYCEDEDGNPATMIVATWAGISLCGSVPNGSGTITFDGSINAAQTWPCEGPFPDVRTGGVTTKFYDAMGAQVDEWHTVVYGVGGQVYADSDTPSGGGYELFVPEEWVPCLTWLNAFKRCTDSHPFDPPRAGASTGGTFEISYV